eukprot:TRINITY_DN67145_c0_g1_i1.p1 TRINITY_DN67145_c0_g1~~TRINITY_DN67145_c0_g1_i1.p1  ORF type:complete len:172 (+),score=33.15 TRINITY_DN67145_c0_g1_i1:68-583(+)
MTQMRTQYSKSYDSGHRLCVSCSGGGAFRKTDLEGAFNEFGDILQIETPRPGMAFVVFSDRADALEAIDVMDKKTVKGMQLSVSWAAPKQAGGPRPRDDNGETPACERRSGGVRKEVLTTTSFERDMGLRGRPGQSKRSRSASRQRDRSPSRRRRSRSRSRRRRRSSSSRS